jgi:hypothetical protein
MTKGNKMTQTRDAEIIIDMMMSIDKLKEVIAAEAMDSMMQAASKGKGKCNVNAIREQEITMPLIGMMHLIELMESGVGVIANTGKFDMNNLVQQSKDRRAEIEAEVEQEETKQATTEKADDVDDCDCPVCTLRRSIMNKVGAKVGAVNVIDPSNLEELPSNVRAVAEQLMAGVESGAITPTEGGMLFRIDENGTLEEMGNRAADMKVPEGAIVAPTTSTRH